MISWKDRRWYYRSRADMFLDECQSMERPEMPGGPAGYGRCLSSMARFGNDRNQYFICLPARTRLKISSVKMIVSVLLRLLAASSPEVAARGKATLEYLLAHHPRVDLLPKDRPMRDPLPRRDALAAPPHDVTLLLMNLSNLIYSDEDVAQLASRAEREILHD